MLRGIKNILKPKKKTSISEHKTPRHIAITMDKIPRAEGNIDLEKIYLLRSQIIKNIINIQVKQNIPVITFFLFSKNSKNSEIFSFLIDELSVFFRNLNQNKILYREQIKVSVLGKWYDLPERAVSQIKEVIESTKD